MIRHAFFAAAVAAATALITAPAAAQDDPQARPAAAAQTPLDARGREVVDLINGAADPAELFTDYFREAVPQSEIDTIGQQLTGQFGAAVGLDGIADRDGGAGVALIRMERAIVRVSIVLDPSQGNRIGGLRILGVEPIDDSPTKITADLQALPGRVSAYFGPVQGDEGPIALNAQDQMPLGSTMKLYVLAQLGREIAQGKRAWSDVVPLDQRSFPSGQMQDWPLGAPVTLHTLASMMISISDNTTTDQLIRVLGQGAMAEILDASRHSDPVRNLPWMTTREMFLLKGGNSERLRTFARSSPEVRAQILAGLEDTQVSAAAIERAFQNGPIALDVEWFANAGDLARLFAMMRAQSDPEVFRIMAINPSVPGDLAEKWDYVGYKGGSEPGVLNLTWLLRDKAGRDRILTLSWEDREASLDEDTLELIAQRILSLPQ